MGYATHHSMNQPLVAPPVFYCANTTRLLPYAHNTLVHHNIVVSPHTQSHLNFLPGQTIAPVNTGHTYWLIEF